VRLFTDLSDSSIATKAAQIFVAVRLETSMQDVVTDNMVRSCFKLLTAAAKRDWLFSLNLS
jgi:hypothetical protein